jgi:hypothetical protein
MHWEALAHLVPTPCHAAGVSPIIGAGCRLGLLLGLLIPAGLPSYTRGSPHRGPDGCALPGIAANGPANSPDGRAAARTAYRPASLGWRRRRLRRVYARLSFRPLMTSVLILLELLLTLPLLGVGKDLRACLTGNQAESQCHVHRDHTPSL